MTETRVQIVERRWVSRRAAATYAGVDPKTFDLWVSMGLIGRYTPFHGAHPRYDLREIDSMFLAGQSTDGESYINLNMEV